MKYLLMNAVILISFSAGATTPDAAAKTAPGSAMTSPTKTKKSDLKTEHNFSDLLINGKYQYPDEALIKVDDDKLLTDLIGYRKNFKDRLNRIGQE